MTVEILASSDKAIALGKRKQKGALYPFATLEVGQSFKIDEKDCNVASLQALTSRNSKGGKRFVMVRHDNVSPPCIEVARVE